MFALDLFNTDHERRLAEGAVDQLEQRRIDDLAMKMDELVARAKKATTPEARAALVKEFQKCKDERDGYYKVQDECMGYGSLGEQDQIPVGRMQPGTPEYVAARNRSVKYADPKPNYAGGHKTGGPATVGYKKTTNKPLVPSELEVAEAGIGQDVVNKQAKMARLNQPVKAGTDVVSPQQRVNPNPNKGVVGHAKDWLTGKGGPGKEGPTYESQKKNSKEVNEHGGGIGTKQHWQDLMQERKLSVGDPVVVTGTNEFEGKTGEIYDFSPSGSFVIVDLYNHGKHSMHLSDVEYNQYANDEDEDDWYDDDELDEGRMSELSLEYEDWKRMAPVSFLNRYKISKENWWAKYGSVIEPKTARRMSPELARSAMGKKMNAMYSSTCPGCGRSTNPDRCVCEGFQDFKKVEPYYVCLAGKPVKRFDYYEQARQFHDNWKKKLYREGDKAKADKITLMPIMDEQDQKPVGWGEFPPKQEITIVPPKKLKSGETYQDRNKYWQSQGQAPIYKTNEAGNPAQQAAIAIAMKQAHKKPKSMKENDDWDDGEWADIPDAHATVKNQQTARYPESVLRAIERNPGMRADIIADYERKQGIAETVTDIRAEMARVYHKLAPKIERYRDSFLAGQLYDELENIAELHGAETEFKRMIAGARNRAHMDYDTNPGGFQNWFWYLPFEDTVTEDGTNYQQQLSRAPAPNAVGSRYQKDMFATPQQTLAQQTNLKTGTNPPTKWKKLNTTTAQDLGVRVDGQYVPAPNGGITVKGIATSYDNKTQYPYALTIDADHQIQYKNVDKLNDDELDAVFQNLASNGLLDRKYINPLKAQIQEEKNKEKNTVKQHAQDQEYLRKDPILNYGGSIGKVRNAIGKARKKNITAKNDVEAMFAQIGDESQINQDQENLINQLSQRLDQADAVNQQQSEVIAKLSTSLKQTSMAPRQSAVQQQQPVSEESTTSSDAVERAILNRIMVAHTDLLMKFGPEKVMQAVEEVAYNVGDVDEIGTSDVSAYVNEVRQILGVPEEVNEKWSQKYKNSINCANPKGFSQKAHCAGKKK
jgi:hypothetical protein